MKSREHWHLGNYSQCIGLPRYKALELAVSPFVEAAEHAQMLRSGISTSSGSKEICARKFDPKILSMKTGAIFMINAWRKRRSEVEQLSNALKDLKENFIKAKNQVQVFNTFYHLERRRNEELNAKMQHSLCSLTQMTDTCTMLESEKIELQKQLSEKIDRIERAQKKTSDLKAELLQVIKDQEGLEVAIEREQYNASMLQKENSELMKEIAELHGALNRNEDNFRIDVEKITTLIKMFERMIEEEEAKSRRSEANLNKKIVQLKADAMALHESLDITMERKLKSFWYQTPYPIYIGDAVFYALQCLVPAIPAMPMILPPLYLATEKCLKCFSA